MPKMCLIGYNEQIVYWSKIVVLTPFLYYLIFIVLPLLFKGPYFSMAKSNCISTNDTLRLCLNGRIRSAI